MTDLQEVCGAELRFDGHTLVRCQLLAGHKHDHEHHEGTAVAVWDDNGYFNLQKGYRI